MVLHNLTLEYVQMGYPLRQWYGIGALSRNLEAGCMLIAKQVGIGILLAFGFVLFAMVTLVAGDSPVQRAEEKMIA